MWRNKRTCNKLLSGWRVFQDVTWKKDIFSLGRNVHKQKHIVLCNLKELFSGFKTRYPSTQIGFSSFCSLRPNNHNGVSRLELVVHYICCVCLYHSSKHQAAHKCSKHQRRLQEGYDETLSVLYREQRLHDTSMQWMPFIRHSEISPI